MDITPPELDEYAQNHCTREEPLLARLTKDTWANAQWPQMQTGHVEGSFLRLLVTITGAKRVLEIGTYTGYSALSMAMGLPEDGVLITCDSDPVATNMAKKYWDETPHGKKIDLRLGDALETVDSLEGLFDLVFIDADKENYTRYWEATVPKVRENGLIVVDNVLWDGKVLDPKEPSDKAIVEFNAHAAGDDRVELVMLTVRDGVTVARKRFSDEKPPVKEE